LKLITAQMSVAKRLATGGVPALTAQVPPVGLVALFIKKLFKFHPLRPEAIVLKGERNLKKGTFLDYDDRHFFN
jgi:hypothetical protein